MIKKQIAALTTKVRSSLMAKFVALQLTFGVKAGIANSTEISLSLPSVFLEFVVPYLVFVTSKTAFRALPWLGISPKMSFISVLVYH